MEEVRAGACHRGQCRQRRLSRDRVALAGGERQHKERRVILGRTARLADLHDTRHDAHAIQVDATVDRLSILKRQRLLADIIGSALRTQNQETVEAHPVIDGPGESTRRIGHLTSAGDRHGLRRALLVEHFVQVHVAPPG